MSPNTIVLLKLTLSAVSVTLTNRMAGFLQASTPAIKSIVSDSRLSEQLSTPP